MHGEGVGPRGQVWAGGEPNEGSQLDSSRGPGEAKKPCLRCGGIAWRTAIKRRGYVSPIGTNYRSLGRDPCVGAGTCPRVLLAPAKHGTRELTVYYVHSIFRPLSTWQLQICIQRPLLKGEPCFLHRPNKCVLHAFSPRTPVATLMTPQHWTGVTGSWSTALCHSFAMC